MNSFGQTWANLGKRAYATKELPLSVETKTMGPLEWLPDESITDQILRLLRENGPMTQRMLSEAVVGGNTTVYRAIDALIESKRVEQGKAKDPVSNRFVKAFRLKA